MLLGALKVLQENKDCLNGKVRFVFQTGEEICRGAKTAIEEGVLDGVDSVFGLHIGSIAGGFAYNVMPGEVIEGTTRALDDGVRKYLAKRIGEISKSIVEAYRGTCECEMDRGAPPVVNDPVIRVMLNSIHH